MLALYQLNYFLFLRFYTKLATLFFKNTKFLLLVSHVLNSKAAVFSPKELDPKICQEIWTAAGTI